MEIYKIYKHYNNINNLIHLKFKILYVKHVINLILRIHEYITHNTKLITIPTLINSLYS